jgi:tRNA A-37 threonylcarbamoyl transferase component Bud32
LGYLKEDDRAIGFVIERLEGHHASISDFAAFETIVKESHGLGILHGDLNRHNFIAKDGKALLVDFETARKCDDKEALRAELEALKGKLLDESRTGGVVQVVDTS